MTTFIEEVHKRFPGLTDDEADAVLWGATCFPCGDADRVLKDLDEMAEASGKDAGKALQLAEGQMFEAMKSIPAE